MDCPKCGVCMGVTHAYQIGDKGSGTKTQRMECPKCFTVCTAVTITSVLIVNPGYGEGANVLARHIAKKAAEAQKGMAASLALRNSGKAT